MMKIALLLLTLVTNALSFASQAVSLTIKGAIGPATADYVVRGINANQDKSLIILRLDTPGGLASSTRQITQAILASEVTVVTYVSPSGARAASAGTFILYASPIAAMAPGTHLGAASPVNLAEVMGQSKQATTMKKKVSNDSIAAIKTLAQYHGRNVDFAVKAVRDAATMTAQEALKAHVINLVASSQTNLLAKLDNYALTLKGQAITLSTKGMSVTPIPPDWRTQLLSTITSPTVAYLLLMLGIYGIFFELLNPGFVVPGVVGAIAMLFALYALHMLPINYAGLALLLLGIVFMLAEAFVPSFGALGIGGLIAFLLGSFLLIDSPIDSYQIATHIIWAVAGVNALVFCVLLSLVLRVRHKPPQNQLERLIGQTGTVLKQTPLGQAKINGEIWRISSEITLKKGTVIEVVSVKGLTLCVTPRP